MDFETMDWVAEAKRVADAFGVIEECHFLKRPQGMGLKTQSSSETHLKLVDGGVLFVIYYPDVREFQFTAARDNDDSWNRIFIPLDGEASATPNFEHGLKTACALFHLQLLTPTVEAALKVTISNHQKLEWQLEYDERVGALL